MMMLPDIPLEIRPARPEEAGVLARMIQAMALESEGRQLDPHILANGIHAVFERPALGTYWVARQDDLIAACTLITVEWSDWHNAPYWWIQSLYILPDLRGRGLFERLLSDIEAAARSEGVTEIRLYVEKNNGRAIRAYQKAGFSDAHYLCMTRALH